jgi:hypothetical protein
MIINSIPMKTQHMIWALMALPIVLISCDDYNVCPLGVSKQVSDSTSNPELASVLFFHYEDTYFDRYTCIYEFERVCSKGLFTWESDVILNILQGYQYCKLSYWTSSDPGWVEFKGTRYTSSERVITTFILMNAAGLGDGSSTVKIQYEIGLTHVADEPSPTERFKQAFAHLKFAGSWTQL